MAEEAGMYRMAAVETESLTKRYGNLHALDNMSMRVPEGSVYALIGPNGAGKTTAFQILCTLLTPTSGKARVFGSDPADEPYEVRGVLGYMPDFFGVYDDIRVREYLDFFAASYRIKLAKRQQIVADLLELVDLNHKADDYVESLSRGMKQRLGLARALVHDPQLLILDEPASGLDPRARVELRELIMELQRLGKTVLISSHILLELEEVCDYVGILEAGKLLAQGPPSEMMAGLRDARAFKLRLAEKVQEERVLDLVRSIDGVAGATQAEGAIMVLVRGDDNAAAEILSTVVGAGIRVIEFAEDRVSLEEVFMQITQGLVQ